MIVQCHAAGSLALANENAVLWLYIALRSNVGLARDWLHNIGMKSHACTTKNRSNVTRLFPAWGFAIGAGYETRLAIARLNVQIERCVSWAIYGIVNP